MSDGTRSSQQHWSRLRSAVHVSAALGAGRASRENASMKARMEVVRERAPQSQPQDELEKMDAVHRDLRAQLHCEKESSTELQRRLGFARKQLHMEKTLAMVQERRTMPEVLGTSPRYGSDELRPRLKTSPEFVGTSPSRSPRTASDGPRPISDRPESAQASSQPTSVLKTKLCAAFPQGEYTLLPVHDFDADATPVAAREQFSWWTFGGRAIQGKTFQAFIGGLIILNAALMGFQSTAREEHHLNPVFIDVLEIVILLVFIFEMVCRLLVIGCYDYFHCRNADGYWNVFDTFIIGFSVVDVFSRASEPLFKRGHSDVSVLRSLRLLRILRLFRIVKYVKQLYLIVFGLAAATKAIFWVMLLMFAVLYVCSIIMVRTLGHAPASDPNQEFLFEHFGCVSRSMMSLFILMSSPNLALYQDEPGLLSHRPLLTIFLIHFIVFGYFGFMALLTGVISESMFEKNELRRQEAKMELDVHRSHMDDSFGAIFDSLDEQGTGEVPVKELWEVVPLLLPLYKGTGLDFTEQDISGMIGYMDPDEDGVVLRADFVRGLMQLAQGVRPVSIEELHFDMSVCQTRMQRLEDLISTLLEQSGSVRDQVAALNAPDVPSKRHLQLVADAVGERVQASLDAASASRAPEVAGLEAALMKLSSGLSTTYTAIRTDFNRDFQDLRARLDLHRSATQSPARAVDSRIPERTAPTADKGAAPPLARAVDSRILESAAQTAKEGSDRGPPRTDAAADAGGSSAGRHAEPGASAPAAAPSEGAAIGARAAAEGVFLQVPGAAGDEVTCEWAWAATSTWHGTAARPRFARGLWELGPVQRELALDARIFVNGQPRTTTVAKALGVGALDTSQG